MISSWLLESRTQNEILFLAPPHCLSLTSKNKHIIWAINTFILLLFDNIGDN